MKNSFESRRLLLCPLALEDYQAFENGVEPSWQGFSNPYRHLVEGPHPLAHRIPRVKLNPDFATIGLVLAIEKETMQIIGSSGFHDFPDERGMIEIGFGIVPERQNQGFGTELLMAMWKMITQHPEVKVLRYTVSPDNAPSLHIINKLGFERVGEQIDEEDGVEIIYEQSRDLFLRQSN